MFNACKKRCGEVMFLQLSVCPLEGGPRLTITPPPYQKWYPPFLTADGGHRNMYGLLAGSMLSCYHPQLRTGNVFADSCHFIQRGVSASGSGGGVYTSLGKHPWAETPRQTPPPGQIPPKQTYPVPPPRRPLQKTF